MIIKTLWGFAITLGCSLASAGWLPDHFQHQLPDPPHHKNAQDVIAVFQAKSLRTAEREKEILLQEKNILAPFYEMSKLDQAACLPQAAFISAINLDAADYVLTIKRGYSRLRPTEVRPDLTTTIPVPWNSSYPSGHATQSSLLAFIFSTWYPQRASDYAVLAQRIADNRVVAGVHYPSDNLAGQSLGKQLFQAYLKNPDFKAWMSKPCQPHHPPQDFEIFSSALQKGSNDTWKLMKFWVYKQMGDNRPGK